MRVLRALGAAIALALLLIGVPLALITWGSITWEAFSWSRLLLPDTGAVFFSAITLVGWLAWGLVLVCFVAEVGSRIGQVSRPQFYGVRWLQQLIAALVAALVLAGPVTQARAAELPRPAPVVAMQHPEPPAVVMTQTPTQWQIHEVAPGDDLWSLAEHYYGDGLHWHEIAEANSCITNPDVLHVGWQLTLPGIPAPSPVVIAGHGHGALTVRQSPAPAPTGTVTVPSDRTVIRAGVDMPQSEPQSAGARGSRLLAATAAADPAAALAAVSASAAGLALTALGALRRRRDYTRPVGRRFIEPDPVAAEHGIRLAAVQSCDWREEVAQVQCWLSHTLPEEIRLSHLITHAESYELYFVDAPAAVPAGVVVDECCWRVSRSTVAAIAGASGALPLVPALIPVGETSQGQVLANLEELGTVSVLGEGADDIITGLVLACAYPEHGAVRLYLTDADLELAQGMGIAARPLAAVESAYAHASLARRRDPNFVEELAPRIVVLRSSPTAAELAEFRARGACVIGPSLPVAGPSLTSTSLVLADDVIECTPLHCSRELQSSLLALAHNAETTCTTAAWWWADDVDGLTYLTPRPCSPLLADRALKEPDVSDPPMLFHPYVRVLGPIELLGARGPEPTRAIKQCIEYAAWLLEHPGGTALQMSSALFVAEPTRRSNMSRLRSWLGKDAETGEPYLPDAYSGRIALAQTVSSDWQEFCLRIAPGVNRATPEQLADALALVRGCPLADAAPSQWLWAEPLRSDMVAVIRDTALRLAEMALDAGDLDVVRWATARGLAAAPEDERLVIARARAEQRAGNYPEVERLALRLTHHARTLGVDLDDETVIALQQLLEHRSRPRHIELT